MTRKAVPERAGLTAAQTRDVFHAYDLRGLQTRAHAVVRTYAVNGQNQYAGTVSDGTPSAAFACDSGKP